MSNVTVADLRAHMNLPDDESDDLLQQKIDAAESWVASYIGQDLADLDPFPAAVTEAILRVAADLYENREASLVGVSADLLPFGVTDLLASAKSWTF